PLEAAVGVIPLGPRVVDLDHAVMLVNRRTAARGRPQRLDLGEDPLAEQVARPREREGGVGVQALQTARTGARAGDAEVELRSQRPLLLVRPTEALGELRILLRRLRPP